MTGIINTYFQQGQGPGSESEQDLVESNIIEMIQMAGHLCYYIPGSMFNPDSFYKEVPSERFERFYQLEMYISSVSDFGGPQADYMSKFGLQMNDTAEFVFSRKRFREVTGDSNGPSTLTPNEGDIIYLPLTKHLFRINHVEDEPGEASSINQFYSLSRLYTFGVSCTLYTYSFEELNTGIDEIDNKFDNTFETPGNNTEIINDEGENILDWSESNPFGETIR